MSRDDVIREDVIQRIMCEGNVDMREVDDRYGIAFERYFASALTALRPMAEDGLVEIAAGRIVVFPRGRLLLRNVAMCFDAYLDRQATPVNFSRAI